MSCKKFALRQAKVSKAKFIFANFEEIICSVFLIIMIVLVITNVFLRYGVNMSIAWAEEVATVCFVWCVFVGASATYKRKLDMGIDLLINLLPLKYKPILSSIIGFSLLAINGYIFYMAIVFTYIAWEKPTAVLGLSSAIFNSSLVVGFGLTTFYTIRFLYHDFKNMFSRNRKA